MKLRNYQSTHQRLILKSFFAFNSKINKFLQKLNFNQPKKSTTNKTLFSMKMITFSVLFFTPVFIHWMADNKQEKKPIYCKGVHYYMILTGSVNGTCVHLLCRLTSNNNNISIWRISLLKNVFLTTYNYAVFPF